MPTDIERIHERIDHFDEKLSKKLDALVAAQAQATGTCLACQATIKRHNDELYGNGRAGLVSTVAAQSERLEQVSRKASGSTLNKTTIVSIIAAVGAAISAALAAVMGG